MQNCKQNFIVVKNLFMPIYESLEENIKKAFIINDEAAEKCSDKENALMILHESFKRLFNAEQYNNCGDMRDILEQTAHIIPKLFNAIEEFENANEKTMLVAQLSTIVHEYQKYDFDIDDTTKCVVPAQIENEQQVA